MARPPGGSWRKLLRPDTPGPPDSQGVSPHKLWYRERKAGSAAAEGRALFKTEGLIAALKRCATQNRNGSADCQN